MKIFTGAQIRELDKYTIEHEPITSEKLMERAATALTGAITERWPKTTRTVVFAGPGNNGGDALAVARMLLDRGYDVSTYLFNVTGHLSADCETNSKRLAAHRRAKDFTTVTADFNPPKLEEGTLVIDGLFGSGLRKPLSGGFASLVKYINQSPTTVVSIDMPSGLMTEDNTYNIHTNIIRADVTLTLQQKKLSMMFAENQEYIGRLEVLDIQLSAEYIDKTDCQCATIEPDMVVRHMRSRDSFAHKGDMGHALLIAGSYGMTGAAILAARACMRSGVGKLTVHTPRHNYTAMQISVPEALIHTDKENDCFSDSLDPSVYNAIGIGPGLGTNENTAMALISQIRRTQCPLVVDADALNILGTHRTWMQQLPEGLILTPPQRVRPPHGQHIIGQPRTTGQGARHGRTARGLHHSQRPLLRLVYTRRTGTLQYNRQRRHGHRRQRRCAHGHHHRTARTWIRPKTGLHHGNVSPRTGRRHRCRTIRRGVSYGKRYNKFHTSCFQTYKRPNVI